MKVFIVLTHLLFMPIVASLCFADLQELSVSEIKTLDNYTDYVRQVEFSPFGTFFAVTVGDNSVFLYDRAFNGLWMHQGNRKNVGGKLSFSPDEQFLAFSRYKARGDIGILNLHELKVVQSLDGHPDYITGVSFSPDGNYLVSCGSEKRIILWEWTGSIFKKKQEELQHEKPIRDISFSPDGRTVASAGDDARIIVWDFVAGKLSVRQVLSPSTYYVTSVAFSPEGDLLASGSTNLLTIWERVDGDFVEIQRIEHHAGGMWSVEFSPDGRYLAAALSNGTVKIWELEAYLWKETHNVYRHNDNVFDASFRSDGKLFATASSDMTAVFWRLEGVKPNPVIALMNTLSLPFTKAQKLIVNIETSKQIMESIDRELTAPKDEFETSAAYEQRMEVLSSHVLRTLQELTESSFRTEEVSWGQIRSPLDALDEYEADEQIYRIRVFGTEGRVHISPEEARSLKNNWERAWIRTKKRRAADRISFDYDDFTLVHPENGKTYAILMKENPFRGSFSTEPGRGGSMGELGPATAAGPRVSIEDIQFDSIFPVFYKYYDEHSIGKAILLNNGATEVENIQVSLFIKQYMDNPNICRAPSRVEPGTRGEVTLYGLFTNRVLEISEGNKVSVKITVDYTAAGKPFTQEFLGTIRIHNRNAVTWDDDKKVAAFVTAKDSAVLKFSKNVAGMVKGTTSKSLNQNLLLGIAVHEALSLYGMSYVIDPTTPHRDFSRNRETVDFIQFPVQTLEYRAGDCDDLSILYNALLESAGIETAFITTPGHIFIAFSLDMTPEEARTLFEHGSDLIVMGDRVWIPLETTMLEEGFLNSWLAGARQWRENLRSGTALFFTTRSAWSTYEPVGFFGGGSLTLPDEDRVVKQYLTEVKRLLQREITSREERLKREVETSGGHPKAVNSLGVLYARYGFEDRAISEFQRILSAEEYPPALMNLGNIYYVRGEYEHSLSYYERAHQREPDNPKILLSLTRVYLKLGEPDRAETSLSRLKDVDAELAQEHEDLKVSNMSETRAFLQGDAETILWED